MTDFDSVFVGQHDTETFATNRIPPTILQKRDVWAGFETARTPTVTEVVSPTPTKVFRGVLAGNYVFSNGTPPAGATDIVVVAEIFV